MVKVVQGASRGVERVRATAFAASTVGLALGAHVTAGGVMPALPLLVLLVALTEGFFTAFAQRRRGPVEIGAALVGAQSALHCAFTLAAPPEHHTGVSPTPTMVLTHGVATLMLAVLLHRGEDVLAWVARLLLPLVVLLPYRPRSTTRVRLCTPTPVPLRSHRFLLPQLSRRGPPVLRPGAP